MKTIVTETAAANEPGSKTAATGGPVVLGEAEMDGVTAGLIDRVTADSELATEAPGTDDTIGVIKVNPKG